ncbi:plasma membrane-type calcium-transporting ATPase [Acrasis kona]|uniref:Calcium-transporting ATPase n=1 Tax=Acrasis kona TaxID=1008807 RepID=A0AAW2YIU6_9EUKA
MVFGITKEGIVDAWSSRDVARISELGGVAGIASKLKTDLRKGLNTEKQLNSDRKQVFGTNVFPEREARSFWEFVVEAFEDETLRILIACAVVSLVFGFFFSNEPNAWIDSVGIFFAIFLVVSVSSLNNWQKENQFRALNRVKDDRTVKVLRDGRTLTMQATDILVGDIIKLDTGDYVPADGLIVECHGVGCDESNLTGESDTAEKSEFSPFMMAGTQLVDGVGSMLVTSVGVNTEWGRTLDKLQSEPSQETPLEKELEKVADSIGRCGLTVAVLMFAVLTIKLLLAAFVYDVGEADKLDSYGILGELLKYVLHAVSLVVAAVPEGLPLAVTISLAFSTKKMLADQNLVRNLAACETMGGATTICSDKTGTLTTNRMTVTEIFSGDTTHVGDFNANTLNRETLKVLTQAISINSTADVVGNTEPPTYTGNKTECAMLAMLSKMNVDYRTSREEGRELVKRVYPFSSETKRMSTSINLNNNNNKQRVFTKGASEIVFAMCDRYVDNNGSTKPIPTNNTFSSVITRMAESGLRTICVAYKDVDQSGQHLEAPQNEYICVAILGIKDPVRHQVPAAIRQCKRSGILVRMVTGDNVSTAKQIARECGIYDPEHGGIAIEGPEFRALSMVEMEEMLPKIQVLARSTPTDKHLLVTTLKRMGEIVAVTGDGTNDAAALKAANVGLSMGLSGTEVAKEASDIVIMDDDFSSIVKSVKWGRSVYENVRKFLQFQITINIVAVMITFVSSVTNGGFPLTAVQLLWVNLIMDTFAALALSTEPPSEDLLNRKPHGRSDSIITKNMWKNILVQSALQLAILLPLIYSHESLLGPISTPELPNHLSNKRSSHDYTLVFNVFVWCQLFNMWNARKINNELNIFENISKSWIFVVIFIITAIGQVAITEYGGPVGFGTTGLTSHEWILSIGLGLSALPVGYALRFIRMF